MRRVDRLLRGMALASSLMLTGVYIACYKAPSISSTSVPAETQPPTLNTGSSLVQKSGEGSQRRLTPILVGSKSSATFEPAVSAEVSESMMSHKVLMSGSKRDSGTFTFGPATTLPSPIGTLATRPAEVPQPTE